MGPARMSPLAWLLLAGVLATSTAGQLFFKGAAVRADRAGNDAQWDAMVRDPLLWFGIATYVVEFLLWLAFLSVVPLWQGVMVASIDILMVMLGGRVFFGEQITPQRVLAISLIALGVVLVGLGGP